MRLSRAGERLVQEALDSILEGKGTTIDLKRNPEADEIRKVLNLRLQKRLLGHTRRTKSATPNPHKSV